MINATLRDRCIPEFDSAASQAEIKSVKMAGHCRLIPIPRTNFRQVAVVLQLSIRGILKGN